MKIQTQVSVQLEMPLVLPLLVNSKLCVRIFVLGVRIIVTSQQLKKIIKKEEEEEFNVRFLLDHTCPPNPTIPCHSFTQISIFSLWLATFIHCTSFLFHFLSTQHTHTPLTHSPTGTLHSTLYTIIFPTRSPKNP